MASEQRDSARRIGNSPYASALRSEIQPDQLHQFAQEHLQARIHTTPAQDAGSSAFAGARSAHDNVIPTRQHLSDNATMGADPNMPTAGTLDQWNNTSPTNLSQTTSAASFGPPARWSGTSLLPEDDGMTQLRQQMHQIRDMALSAEEKAQMMHKAITAEYHKLTLERSAVEKLCPADPDDARSRSMSSRSRSSGSTRSGSTPESFAQVSEEERKPTYYMHDRTHRGRDCGDDETDEGPPLGCEHYMRNVKVQCPECRRFYTCRHCHDKVEDHLLIRRNIRNMLCMQCGYPQRASEYCRQCDAITACYYCEICKLWDNDSRKPIYHCPDCGICRRGEGLGKDYLHCNKCNVCVSIQHAQDHRCVERATDCDCPICGDYMFSSLAAVVAMKCGHYIHRSCYNELMSTTYKCPICSRSAVNMELQWRKMDECIESQPMPSQYQNTKAWIICNDCTMRSCVPFHWLGNKCRLCDSYNTTQTRLMDEPREHAQGVEAQQHRVAQAAGIPHPSSGSLTANSSWSRLDVIDDVERQHHIADPAGGLEPAFDYSESDREYEGSTITGTERQSSPAVIDSPPSPLNRAQHESAPSTRHHSDSSISAPASIISEVEDEYGFWGEGINPGDYMPSMPQIPQMPQMPSMPRMPSLPRIPSVSMPSMPHGWRSPRLFAHAEDDETLGSEGAQHSWRLDPRQWRLGSPTEFFRSPSSNAEADISDEDLSIEAQVDNKEDASAATRVGWDPRHWRLPSSPTFFADTGETDDTAASPGSNSGWPMDPRQWRLASPSLFGRSRSVDTAIPSSPEHAEDRQGTSPSSIWDIHPRSFLARRFGSFSMQDTSDVARSDSSDDGASEGSDDTGEDSQDEDDEDGQGDDGASGNGDADEDELDLIGHR